MFALILQTILLFVPTVKHSSVLPALKIGRNKGFVSNSEDISTLTIKENNIVEILKSKKIMIGTVVVGLILMITLISLF